MRTTSSIPRDLNAVAGILAACAISLPLWYAIARIIVILTVGGSMKLVVYGACGLVIIAAVWLASAPKPTADLLSEFVGASAGDNQGSGKNQAANH